MTVRLTSNVVLMVMSDISLTVSYEYFLIAETSSAAVEASAVSLAAILSSAKTAVDISPITIQRVSRMPSIRFFISCYLRFAASNKTLFLFQYNVQDQAEVTKQRNSCNRTDNNQSRSRCRYVSVACGNGCIRRRFHTGVFLTDPPVAVFADEGGQTVLTVCTGNTVFAVGTILTVSAGNAVFAVGTILTVSAGNAVFAVGTILTVSTGIPFVALFAFLAGCPYAE